MFEKANETIAKLGLEKGRWLGSGFWSNVWEDKNDPTRVIKITADYTDACVAELARRAQEKGECPNLMRVYRVVECAEPDKCGMFADKDYSYVILGERLRRIPTEAYDHLPRHAQYIDVHSNFDLITAARHAAEGNAAPADLYPRKCTNVWSVAALNCKGMVDDLRSIGVKHWDDFKLENVMIRSGYGVVVSDFGQTESPRPELERLTT